LPDRSEIAAPPTVLRFESLSDLFRQYLDLLVATKHQCPRGMQVVFEPYHFFHLVKLKKRFQTAFKISEEREAILSTDRGFGDYEIDRGRAEKLSWIPSLITNPHEIFEYDPKKTADEVFIREYEKSGSPFKVLLLMREEDYLVPVTSMTVKRPGIKEHRRGKKLWPK
jgi:hypothetical protein